MTRRQSNNQWIDGITAHPEPPQKIPSENIRWKISRLVFMGSRRLLLIDYRPNGQIINAEYYSSLLAQLKYILKEKLRGKITKVVWFLHDNAPAHRALAIQKKLAHWVSSIMITHPILWIYPCRTTTGFLDWKNNWNVAIFRPTLRSLLPRRPDWTDNIPFFFLFSFSFLFLWVACKCTSTFRREPGAKGSSSLEEDTQLLHYKFQQVNAIQGEFGCFLWQTCGIQKQTVWTKSWISFVTSVFSSCSINCTNICYPNFNGP